MEVCRTPLMQCWNCSSASMWEHRVHFANLIHREEHCVIDNLCITPCRCSRACASHLKITARLTHSSSSSSSTTHRGARGDTLSEVYQRLLVQSQRSMGWRAPLAALSCALMLRGGQSFFRGFPLAPRKIALRVAAGGAIGVGGGGAGVCRMVASEVR